MNKLQILVVEDDASVRNLITTTLKAHDYKHKSKSALMIFDRHANLKYKYGSRHFWCRGYYADTVGKNAKIIEEYIRNQLEEDVATDQVSLKEYMDPFTGERVK